MVAPLPALLAIFGRQTKASGLARFAQCSTMQSKASTLKAQVQPGKARRRGLSVRLRGIAVMRALQPSGTPGPALARIYSVAEIIKASFAPAQDNPEEQ